MWSAQRLAASRSERSSASSEARNSATSIALRSLRQPCRRALELPPWPVLACTALAAPGLPRWTVPGGWLAVPEGAFRQDRVGGSVRTRALMNAWYDGKELLTCGSVAFSVTAGADSSSRRACGGGICVNVDAAWPQ